MKYTMLKLYPLLIAMLISPSFLVAQHTEADHDAIIENIAAYVDAFNAGDAQQLANRWSPDGHLLDQDTGNRVRGREAIESHFAKIFSDSRPRRIDLSVEPIRFVTGDVAVQEGVATIVGPNQADSHAYTAIHVKQDGSWKLHSIGKNAIDSAAGESFQHEQLTALEWMIGEWIDQNEHSTIHMTCRWTKNRKFLSRSFKVIIGDRIDLEGTQVIGWDPRSGSIRSWLFDSDGGFGEGYWTRQNDQWEVASLQTLSDGSIAKSKNIYTVVDGNKFTVRSIGRKIGDQILPNIEDVTVVRKTPATASK